MLAGAIIPKSRMKAAPWLSAYETWNAMKGSVVVVVVLLLLLILILIPFLLFLLLLLQVCNAAFGAERRSGRVCGLCRT
jgi:hypothetical protein